MKSTLVLLLLLGSLRVFAQDSSNRSFQKGDRLLNLGLGLNSYYEGGLPLSVSYEKATGDKASLGLGMDYLHHSYDDPYIGKYGLTALYLGVRGAFHVNQFLETIDFYDDKLDVYIGASLGYRLFSWKSNYTLYPAWYTGSYYGSGLYYGAYLGGKYYFTSKLGAFLEAGATGSTNARIGLCFKF
jgi:hypothetical protein